MQQSLINPQNLQRLSNLWNHLFYIPNDGFQLDVNNIHHIINDLAAAKASYSDDHAILREDALQAFHSGYSYNELFFRTYPGHHASDWALFNYHGDRTLITREQWYQLYRKARVSLRAEAAAK